MTASEDKCVAESFSRSVAVIGGGIAGITAAVKLFKQGYHVTLFEKSDVLGGNYSSSSPDNQGGQRDVYPHIIGGWYKEFRYLLEKDFELPFEELYAKRDKIKMAIVADDEAKSFSDVHFADLATPTSLLNLFNNLESRILSKRNMALFGYTYLDLVSEPKRSKRMPVLQELDVTGYLYSRPFMNERIAELHDAILKVIWSIPSNQTAAAAYQDLLRHTLTFPNEMPFAWLLKGPADKKLMKPLQDKLLGAFGRDKMSALRLSTEVQGISVDPNDDHVILEVSQSPGMGQPPVSRHEKFRFAIVATPCQAAVRLALSGERDATLIKRAQQLARLREGTTGRIPVVYLYFTEEFVKKQGATLASLPEELIGFQSAPRPGKKPDSNEYDISILDISKLWDKACLDNVSGNEPVLVLAASRCDAISEPGPGEGDDKGERQGFALIKKLQEYLPFIQPGTEWGQGGDVDWKRTRVITNSKYQLFLNDAGSETWRPRARVKNLKNVFFAGDYCLTDVDMATVEAAVQSGVFAAQEVQKAEPHGHPICLQPHDLYGNNVLLCAKLCAMPMAFAIAVTELVDSALRAPTPMDAIVLPYEVMVKGAAYGSDWVRSAVQLSRSYSQEGGRTPSGARSHQGVADHDRQIGVVEWAIDSCLALIDEGPTLMPLVRTAVADAVNSTWQHWTGAAPHAPPDEEEDQESEHGASGGPKQRAAHVQPRKPLAQIAVPDDDGNWMSLRIRKLSLRGLSEAGAGVLGAAKAAFGNFVMAPLSDTSGGAAQGSNTGLKVSDALKSAVKAGADARREKERGFRVYNQLRGL